MRTDGSRKLTADLDECASDDYREKFFDYKSISPLLAAQVGTLATMLGYDYSVGRAERPEAEPAYRVRFVAGFRQAACESRLHERPVEAEWVYDIECAGLHNFVCGVGNVVCHNTNEPEYRRLQNNEFMEALRDRTVKIDVPTSPGSRTKSRSTRRTSTGSASRASTSPRTPSRSRPCGRC